MNDEKSFEIVNVVNKIESENDVRGHLGLEDKWQG